MATFTKMSTVPNPIIVDAAGTAGSGYVLKCYLPGTTTVTNIATDSTGGTTVASMTANAKGKWEVSGNEVIPHIDRKCKWGIFANSTDAAANTPFYMGPFNNVEQSSSSTSDNPVPAFIETQLGSAAVSRVFTLTLFAYQVGATNTANLMVFRNGQKLTKGVTADYTETTSTTVTLNFDPNANDSFDFIASTSVSTATSDASTVTYTPAGSGAIATDVQTKLREWVSVKDFGAVGDGVTDDTAALNLALAAFNGTLHFSDAATYLISSKLSVTGKTGFSIDLAGSTIKMADGTAVAGGYELLLVQNCHKFKIVNGIFDANRANRTPAAFSAQSIRCLNVSDFTFDNVRSINAVVDGFYFDSPTPADTTTHARDGVLLNCVADNAWRNGMSIIQGRNIQVMGGKYNNTNGGNPGAGIDLESDSSNPAASLYNINIFGIEATGNDGYGVQISNEANPRKITVKASSITSNLKGAIFLGCADGTIDDNDFEGYSNAALVNVIETGFVTGTVEGNTISNNRFRNISPADTTKSCIASDSTGGAQTIYGNKFYSLGCRAAEIQATGTRYTENEHYNCTENNLVSVPRDGVIVRENYFDNCSGFSNINVSADDVEVSSNRHINQTNVAINFATGAERGRINDNYVKFTTLGTNNGITVRESFRSLQGNIIENADTIATAYTLSGGASTEAIGYKRRNLCIDDTGNERLAEN